MESYDYSTEEHDYQEGYVEERDSREATSISLPSQNRSQSSSSDSKRYARPKQDRVDEPTSSDSSSSGNQSIFKSFLSTDKYKAYKTLLMLLAAPLVAYLVKSAIKKYNTYRESKKSPTAEAPAAEEAVSSRPSSSRVSEMQPYGYYDGQDEKKLDTAAYYKHTEETIAYKSSRMDLRHVPQKCDNVVHLNNDDIDYTPLCMYDHNDTCFKNNTNLGKKERIPYVVIVYDPSCQITQTAGDYCAKVADKHKKHGVKFYLIEHTRVKCPEIKTVPHVLVGNLYADPCRYEKVNLRSLDACLCSHVNRSVY